MRSRWFYFCLPILAVIFAIAVQGQEKQGQDNPVSVSGKWQISWEARLGTAHGTVQLDQSESKLAGSFQGQLGAPKVSGTIEGKNVRLVLDFQRAHPFTLVFRGLVDGDKMAGKFEIAGVEDGYDSHGEGVRPSNYSWTAVRQVDPPQSQARQRIQPDAKN